MKFLTNTDALKAKYKAGAKYEDGTPIQRWVPLPEQPPAQDIVVLQEILALLKTIQAQMNASADTSNGTIQKTVDQLTDLGQAFLAMARSYKASATGLETTLREIASRDSQDARNDSAITFTVTKRDEFDRVEEFVAVQR